MEVLDLLRAIRRWWWLVVVMPLVALIAAVILVPAPPYETSFRATVVIPGDTEDTGSAERPELMVLDDLAPLVASEAFATLVHAQLGETSLTIADVQDALSGSRYSRIATVTIAADDPEETRAIAAAAADVFPEAINTYLVAPGAEQASVQIIDVPGDPAQSQRQRVLTIAIVTFVAGVIGVAVVAVIETLRGSRRT